MLAERLGSPMTSIMCVGAPGTICQHVFIVFFFVPNEEELTIERLAEDNLELARWWGCDHTRHFEVRCARLG